MKELTKEERICRYRNYLISAFDFRMGFNFQWPESDSKIEPITYDIAEAMLLNKRFSTGAGMVLAVIDNEAYDPDSFSLELELKCKDLVENADPVSNWYSMLGDMNKQWGVEFPPVHPVLVNWSLSFISTPTTAKEIAMRKWNENHIKMAPYNYWSWAIIKLEESSMDSYKIPEQMVHDYIEGLKSKGLKIYHLSYSK